MNPTVSDLDTSSPHERSELYIAMTPETVAALAQLTDVLAPHRSFLPKEVPLNRREYEKKFTQWMATGASEATRNRAAMISLSRSYEAAMEYFRAEFDKEFAHVRPTNKLGRPSWYIPPQKERRLLQGEVIAHLINLASGQLLKQLTTNEPKSKRA